MTTKTFILSREKFFHARPAAIVASAAKQFDSVIMIAVGNGIADAKNLYSLMRLEKLEGRAFDVIADGSDELEAVQAIADAITTAF